LPPEMRGRTTQNRVSSTSCAAKSLTSSAVTITVERSFAISTLLTSPISTSLNFSLVLPASRPSAVLKVIVITGPLSSIDFTASQPPTSAAMSGISHTSCTVRRDFFTATASGMSFSLSATLILQGVPHQARVESHRREHGQHHHRAECDCAGPGHYRRQGLQLHQSAHHCDDVDV